MKNGKKKLFLSSLMFISLMVIMLIYFSIGELTLPRENSYIGTDLTEIKGWKQVMSDGTAKAVALPGSIEAENGQIVLTTRLPDVSTCGEWMMFWNHGRNLQVYVEDELRLTYDTQNSRAFGKYSPFSYLFVKLNDNESGKTITIRADETYTDLFDQFYMGDRLSLIVKAMSPYLIEILFALFLMGIGATCIIVLSVVEIIIKEALPITHLSWAVFAVSIWIIANDGARQFFFPNVSVVRDVAYICVGVMPLPFLMYCDQIQNLKYHLHYLLLEILGFMDALAVIMLYMTEKMDWVESFKYIEIICFIDIAFVCYTLVKDIIIGRIKDYIFPAITILVLAIAIGTQITLFIAFPSMLYNGIIVELGMFIALILSVINTVMSLSKIQLEKTRAVMESEEKAKFLASMSHEIRTPINAVLGMNELILREAKDDKIMEYAANIEDSGRILLALINDVLDFSKIEAGQMAIVPVEYMTSSLINDVISITKVKAVEKGLEYKVEIDPKTPAYLMGDELRVRQIIINLLTNAVKYTKKGTVTLKVGFKYDELGQFKLKVKVKDTGIGIKPEDQERLFDSFKRVDELKNRGIEGTGLGLSITKNLLTQMGGTIAVKSTYHKGSEFVVEIPQMVVGESIIGDFKEKRMQPAKKSAYKEMFHAPNARVLVVDDNNMNLAVFKGLLANTQIKVDTASSGKECIDKAMEERYDAIYLDHMMPNMDGVETLSRLKQLGQCVDIPVIALTANAIHGAKEMYLEKGFCDYLPKPIEGHSLEENLRKWLPDNKLQAVEYRLEDLLDTSVGMSHCADNKEFYQEMIAMYIDGDKRKELEESFNNKDWESYRIQMHSLKSTSLTIGAVELSERAKAQETAAKNMDYEYISSNHNEILEKYGELLENLKKT